MAAASNAPDQAEKNIDPLVLLITVFVVGLCTIVYELLIGSVSAYFLGDSVTQFSLTIGLSMTAMGIGTLISRYIQNNLIRWFVLVEFTLGVVGGLSVPILFAAYAYTDIYQPVMLTLVMIIGILIGLEIPLLTRIMERDFSLRANISNVLSLDYFGALAASLLFPFAMLPFFGIFASSLITGLINLFAGCYCLWYFRRRLGWHRSGAFLRTGLLAVIGIATMLVFSGNIVKLWEKSIYEDTVIHSEQSRYQKIVLTRNRHDLRLYLDGHLQFSSIDEYRYHEVLAHIPLAQTRHRNKVLVFGGGDGLLLRELLKYPDIQEITLVDLDPAITRLGREHPQLRVLNGDSMRSNRVTIVNDDAFTWLKTQEDYFDIIIADLPDPRTTSLSRLYSREFYKLIRKKLARQGVFVTQATSPYFATDAFWSISETVKAAGFQYQRPFHAYVPSFGDWGFVMASSIPLDATDVKDDIDTRFLAQDNYQSLFVFPRDLQRRQIKASSLNAPAVLDYYLAGWKNWN